jgi:hypothetical protein
MKKNKVKLLCKYCEYFVNSSIRQVDSSESTNKYYRKCEVKNDFIMETSLACEHFKMASKIFCPTYEYWVTPEMCLARILRKYCSKSCKVYKIIKESLNV